MGGVRCLGQSPKKNGFLTPSLILHDEYRYIFTLATFSLHQVCFTRRVHRGVQTGQRSTQHTSGPFVTSIVNIKIKYFQHLDHKHKFLNCDPIKKYLEVFVGLSFTNNQILNKNKKHQTVELLHSKL